MNNVRAVLISVLFLLLTVSANAAPVDLAQNPWVIEGFDISNWDGSDLVFTSQTEDGNNFLLEGYFDWKSNDVFRGRELFTGTLSSDLSLHVEGFQLVNPIQIQLSIYDADVTTDGQSIINGTWVGISGSPNGVWSASAVPLPAALPMFLSCITFLGIWKARKA